MESGSDPFNVDLALLMLGLLGDGGGNFGGVGGFGIDVVESSCHVMSEMLSLGAGGCPCWSRFPGNVGGSPGLSGGCC